MGIFGNLEQMSYEELVKQTHGMARDNPMAATVERILQQRNGQRQVDAGKALVRATKQLAIATWVLAVITTLMLLTAAAQAYLVYKGMK